jgi:hypothetical protein
MSELVTVSVVAIVGKNIVNFIKMLTIKNQRLDAFWLVLSGLVMGAIAWILGLEINIFKGMGVETSTLVSVANGVLLGLMGQDFFKIMKYVQMKTPKTPS